MPDNKNSFQRIFYAMALWFFCAVPAAASFLDTDFFCRTYGCVVVHDGQNFDLYDNFQFSTNSCCIPFETPMVAFSNRANTPNVTGTLSQQVFPTVSEGMMFGVVKTADGQNIDLQDDGNGFIDANDVLSAFSIGADTDIALTGSGESYSHSFFISSRNTRFSVRGLARKSLSTGELGNALTLRDFKFESSFSRAGQDDAFAYGRRATSNGVVIPNNISNLGDLEGTSAVVLDFNRLQGIRRGNGDINDQTIRLDFLYRMPDYDFSMGVGNVNIDVEFEFYREQ